MNVSMLKFNVTVGYSYFVKIKKIIEYLILNQIFNIIIHFYIIFLAAMTYNQVHYFRINHLAG